MAYAALATQSRAATNVSRVERPSDRGPVKAVRPTDPANAFQSKLGSARISSAVAASAARAQKLSAGSSLLSTNVQMVLAETRTLEASTSFVPSSSVSRAIDSYVKTQAKIRETIRDNAVFGNNANAVSGEAAGEETSTDAKKANTTVAIS